MSANTPTNGAWQAPKIEDYYGTFDAEGYQLKGRGKVSVAKTLAGDAEGQVAKVYLGAVTAAMQEGLTAMSKQPLTAEVLAAMQNLSTAVGVVVNVSKTLAAADKTAGELARAG